MSQRRKEAAELFGMLFDRDEYPWFVSDEASLWDIYMEDEKTVREKIKLHYGITPPLEQLAMPLWKFLDVLSNEREFR